jgi:hypothetical protein
MRAGPLVQPWLAAWLGGVVGTGVMTVAVAGETKLRPNSDGPVDYDASDHVVIAACNLAHRRVPRSAKGRRRIFNTVHWGYGSAVALAYEAARRATGSESRATVAFYLGCQAMALTLFPTVGETPPPWRWKREVLVSSFSVHALYAVTVATVSHAVR